MRNPKPRNKKSNGYKVNKIDWKFDFYFDFKNKRSKIHRIEKDGKTMKCDCDNDYCHCFSTISNSGMKPNSGIYNIKIKINKVSNQYPWSNTIGITSEKYMIIIIKQKERKLPLDI